MEKYCLCVVCLLVSCVLFSGCSIKQNNSPINYQRRLEKYLPQENTKPPAGVVDLSEGPRTRYDAKFGPRDLDFDVKINTRY